MKLKLGTNVIQKYKSSDLSKKTIPNLVRLSLLMRIRWMGKGGERVALVNYTKMTI
jgi:hypothetical protein